MISSRFGSVQRVQTGILFSPRRSANVMLCEGLPPWIGYSIHHHLTMIGSCNIGTLHLSASEPASQEPAPAPRATRESSPMHQVSVDRWSEIWMRMKS